MNLLLRNRNFIIDNIERIQRSNVGSNTVIRIPFQKFLKWFIPNPMSNLDDCLSDLKFKNLDKERYFNI